MKTSEKYDVIIIGSGMGALTSASLLAQLEGKRILILERHFQAGGYTHAFKRKRQYEWDVGLHYVGGLGNSGDLRKIFDYITKGKLKWQQMPDPYDVFHYPEIKFGMVNGAENVKAALIERFPDEENNLKQYFRDVKRANNWFRQNEMKKNLPALLQSLSNFLPNDQEFALQPLSNYLGKNFNNKQLKAVLTSQWGDYGLPPAKAPFVIHALLTSHYFEGAYFPIGGAGRIYELIEPILENTGGKVLVNHKVEEILIQGNKAIGVRVVNSREKDPSIAVKEYYADTIISGAGAHITYKELIPKSYPISFREKLNTFQDKNKTTAHLSLYLGLKDSPEKLGFKGENHWIFADYDHDAAFDKRNQWIKDKQPVMAYLSFPSLKNPEATGHTAEIITFADYEFFEKWRDQPWKKRDAEYKTLKSEIAASLLNFVNERFPGFTDLIDYQELSTPLTTEYMTGHHRGTIYGLSSVAERFDLSKSPWCQARTPIDNLFMTGTEASAWGIGGALFGGLLSTIHIVKPWNLPRLLKLL